MLLLTVVSGGFFLQISTLLGQQRQAPQTIKAGSSCLAKQCHASLRTGPVVHGPLAEGDDACQLCHEGDGNRHAFSYPATGSELCYSCHESVTEKKLVHAPLKDKETACTICHNPHSSLSKQLLNFKSTNDLCLSCHKEVAQGGMYHDAEKIAACTSCHQPHSSDTGSYLRGKSPDLCYSCHNDLKDTITEAAMVHGPVGLGCSSCHDAHRELAGKGLAKTAPDLCVDCHDDFKPTVAQMSSRHHLLLEEKNCSRCHEPHAGKFEQLLLGDSQSLCLSCHGEEVKSADGRVIASLKEVLAEDLHRHGPGKSLDCAVCHEPHANKQYRFFRGQYPQTFYSPYSPQAYSLCFTCHDESLATAVKTDEATEFRNGQTNLHYLHVNKKRKGRSCRTCHAWHVSKNPQLLRESVPFGQWRIPINFRATDNGGSCSPGCHQSKAYDRVNTVSDDGPSNVPSDLQPLPGSSTPGGQND